MKNKFIAATVEGRFDVHGPAVDGNYDTLCGMDIDDPAIEHYPAELPNGAKITCAQCRKIFDTCRTLRITDFEGPNDPT